MADNTLSTSANGNILKTIPDEVFHNYIIPYLHRNEVLRFRRSCKHIKRICDDYIRNNYKINQEINTSTLNDVLFLGFHFQRMHLHNLNELLEHPEYSEFTEWHASNLTQLRVERLSDYISERETSLFETLTNLERLEIDYVDAFDKKYPPKDQQDEDNAPRYFPSTFKRLKTLNIGSIEIERNTENQRYIWKLMESCTELEYFKHPYSDDAWKSYSTYPDFSNSPFDNFLHVLIQRRNETPGEPLKLKYYDIEFVPDDNCTGFAFANLVKFCYDNKIKLINVHGRLFEQVINVFDDNEQFSVPIMSVKNLHGHMLVEELPNLEQVVVTSTRASCFDSFCNNEDAAWPNLKVLDLTIDSQHTAKTDEVHQEKTEDLLKFLFVNVIRPRLADFRLRFNQDYFSQNLPYPRAADMLNSCKHITKFTLTNWLGTNKAVSKLWGGWPHLEEVTLEKCKLLGNVAFVGTNKEDPVFLKLKKLKKFTLSGLDQMPKITDLIFNLVFQHLRIQHFYLSSKEPLKSITANGIRSLLSGEFNNCVEKFPFTGWSLDGVSKEEFAKLKSEFKATHML